VSALFNYKLRLKQVYLVGLSSFNVTHVKHYRLLKDILDTVYYIIDGNSVQELEKVINDLGVIFDSSLSFRDHISHKN